MRTAYLTALVVAIIGALNWGLVGLFQYDLVADLFGGETATASRFVYTVVGLSGLFLAITTASKRRDFDQPVIRRAA